MPLSDRSLPAENESSRSLTVAPTPATGAPGAAAIEWALIALVVLALALGPRAIGGDGAVRFEALSALLGGGAVPPGKYSLVGPLFSAPLWFLGRLFGATGAVTAFHNWLVVCAGLAAILVLWRKQVPAQRLRRLALLLLCTSMLPRALHTYYGEVFTAMCFAVAFAAMVTDRRALGSSLLVLGVVNTPASAVAAGLVAGAQVVETRRARWALVVVACAGGILLESWLRRGSPLNLGYEDDHGFATALPYSGRAGFSYPLFFGVLSLLFSFGKGVVWFAPGLCLPGSGDDATLARWRRLGLLALVGLVLVYGGWWAWYGGWSWGPRFLLMAAFPAAVSLLGALEAPAGRPWRDVAGLIALTLSFWVGLEGLLWADKGLEVCSDNHYALEALCWYAPEMSPLWHPFVQARPLDGYRVLCVVVWSLVLLYLARPVGLRLAAHARGPALDALRRLRQGPWTF